MPSVGISVYYRQSSKILRNLRSFNLVVRWASLTLRLGLDVEFPTGVNAKGGVDPIVVAILETDLEYWIHRCWAVCGRDVLAGGGGVKRRLGEEGRK